MLDVFKSDVYGVVSLTAAVNKLPYVPSRLGQLNIFKKKGVTTTSIVVEEERGKLFVVPTAARGSNPNVYGGKKRQARSFVVPHVPLIGNVFADDVQNIRAFGSETEVEAVAGLVNDKLSGMRQAMETTQEWMRIGALNGKVLDADLTVIYDWFAEFGIAKPTITLDFTANTTRAVKTMCNNVRRMIEDALGMSTYTGIRAICGSTIYDAISGSTEVNHAYFRKDDSSFLRASHVRGEFEYGGVNFEEYRGKIGTAFNGDGSFIPPTHIYFYPEGTSDIFLENYAPANFIETVNTMGKAVYAKQRPMDWDMGIELHVQSNPLLVCTRPGVLVECTAITGTPLSMNQSETSENPPDLSNPEHVEEGAGQ
jgi:hypothetical protein